jgi:glycine oxidase
MADCDVAVIGAGAVGGAAAYELASRGASVAILESRGVGLGSTQAAAGMLVPFIEGFGRPILPLAARSLEMYGPFIDRLSRDAGVGVGYVRLGSLQVALETEEVEELREIQQQASAAGVSCELLDGPGALGAEQNLTPDVKAGLMIRDHGVVVASELCGALSAAAIKHGARVIVPALVRRVVARGDEIDIQLESGDRLTARQVVVAAGSWSGRIAIEGIPPVPVRPVRGQLLQVSWTSEPLKHIVWGPRCYVVPFGPRAALIGATMEEAGFDERTTVAAVRDLLDAACELIPSIWNSSFVAARVGLRPACPDEMPFVGRSRAVPGVIFATGHFRNGILLAPLTAKAVADLVLENREDPLLASASPQRFGEF